MGENKALVLIDFRSVFPVEGKLGFWSEIAKPLIFAWEIDVCMASETAVGIGNDEGKKKQRYMESKVYTRKSFKGLKNNNAINKNSSSVSAKNSVSCNTAVSVTAEPSIGIEKNNVTDLVQVPPQAIPSEEPSLAKQHTLSEVGNSAREQPLLEDASLAQQQPPSEVGNSAEQQPSAEAACLAHQQPLSEPAHSTQQQQPSEDANMAEQQPFSEDACLAQQQPLPEVVHSAQRQKLSEDANSARQQPLSEDVDLSRQQLLSGNAHLEDANLAQQQPVSRMDVVSDDTSSLNKQQSVAGNGIVKPSVANRLKINLSSAPKQGIHDLRMKLENELDMVRRLIQRIEEKEGKISGVTNVRALLNDGVDNGLRRIQSEVNPVGASHEAVRQSRPLNQLSISVMENNHGITENVEKEKRTPKANQFYRNSEFLLAKDKFPPAESNKKSKLNGKRQGGGELMHGFGMSSKIFKSCSALLERLMKHKHGWVFNAPVDVQGLGLLDYYTIIKQPMDLGTIKSRLNKNWYKSPREFAEDVRLTFSNAMTYNPKGQDVHIMAEQLSEIFEQKWVSIEADYNRERFPSDYQVGLPLFMPRRTPPSMLPPPLDMRRIMERSDSMMSAADLRPKSISGTPTGRTPTPKKPKAKDPHKREMTYEEKQKLSSNLQSLPSEKLDNIVQIIKKRNSALFQHDDEIEVDIDSVDTETLWELDRFVTNYKKSLSKHKRKAELANQARAEAEQVVPEKNNTPLAVEVSKENKTDERNTSSSIPVGLDKQQENSSRSSSSSSSSSDSGSSSSDSDSDSSSASGSDGGH